MRNGRFRFSETVVFGFCSDAGSGRRDGHRRLGHGCGLRQQAGIAAAGVAALNAGVDLILVSYDPSSFNMMNALITADRAGGLASAALAGSDRRPSGMAR
jgi:hypothetical protein